MKKIRILIAEDHKLIRETWMFLLNSDPRFEVIAACNDSSEAVCLAHLENPDIVLMDINMLPLNGFLATSRILLGSPRARIIGLSFHNEPWMAHRMFAAGAKGYVTKNSGREEIEEAIISVHNGGEFVCKEIADTGFKISSTFRRVSNKLDLLTKKEAEICQFIKAGLRAKEISEKLAISVRTVDVHRTNIFKKLSLKSSLALIHFLNNDEKRMEYN